MERTGEISSSTRNAKPETQNFVRWAALLLTACVLTYANSLPGAFTYDDKAVVRDNPRILAPQNIGDIFRTSYFGGPRGRGTAYRPVLLLSFALQFWVHGADAAAYHAANILFHVAATLLLLRLLLRLAMPPPLAGAAALLFAVHPIHVEAVASVVGRGETQAAVFVLAYLLAALAIAERRQTRLALAAAAAFYVLGALTKEGAAVAPGLAFLLLLARGEGGLFRRARQAFVGGWPLFAVSAAGLLGIFAVRAFVLGGALRESAAGIYELENPLAPLPALGRVWNACAILVRYAGRIVFPLELTADESAWSLPVWTGRSPGGWAAAALVAAAIVGALRRLRDASPVALGILFFCVAFLPAANVLFPIGTVFAERLAYLPSAGLCVVLAAAFVGSAGSFGELTRARVFALAAAALLLASRAAVRNTVWRTDDALFANCVRTAPGSAKAWYNDAFIAVERKDFLRGRSRALRAVTIYDNYWDACAVQGRAERELGLLAEAEASYAKSVELNPSYENGWYGLSGAREARGDLAGAEKALAAGLSRRADSLPLAFHLARIRTVLGRPAAEEDWKRALMISPGSVAARLGYAGWLLAHGQEGQARRQWREALRRQPANLEALRSFAESNARRGLHLAECLAREKIFRLSGTADDRAAQERGCQSFWVGR